MVSHSSSSHIVNMRTKTKKNKKKTVLCIPPFVLGNSAYPKLTKSRLTRHRYLTENKKWDTPPGLISSICETTKNKCFAFHPSSVMMWESSADSELTESRLKNHWQFTENKSMSHSSSSHIINIRKQKKSAMHSTLRPWWRLDTQLSRSSPRADWPLIDTSPKIKIWDTPLVLIPSTWETTKKRKNATHSILHPWWCLDTQLAQSSPKLDWTLIDTSPKMN